MRKATIKEVMYVLLWQLKKTAKCLYLVNRSDKKELFLSFFCCFVM